MKPSRLLFLPGQIFCLILILFSYNATSAVAEPGSSPSIEDRLQSLLSASENKINLAETALLISQQWEPSLDPVPLKAELDRLTTSVRRQLKDNSSGKEIVAALRKAIHNEGGYRYTDQVDGQGIPLNSSELFMHGLLTTRRGYCMNLSILYLIVGERLDLPLYGVALPNHFFVRYESGDTRINIEATELGQSYPDSFYLQRFSLTPGPQTTFFMQNLDKKQTLGAYFSNVGMVFYKNGKPKQAVFYLGLSTEINKQSVEAHNNLANIYAELKDFDPAIRHYELALKSDPENFSTLYNLGQTYKDSGDWQKAIQALLQVVQINPSFSPAHRSLVEIFMERKEYISALLHLKKLVQFDPANISNHIALGKVYLRLGEDDLALKTLESVGSRSPGNPEILEGLAEAHYRKENFDRSIEIYRYLIENQPENMRAYIQLGWVYYRKNELKLASSWTRQGLQNGKGAENLKPLAQMNMGLYSVLEKNYAEAKTWYSKALAFGKNTVAEGMVTDLKEAQLPERNRPDLEFFIGWIYIKSGRNEEGKKFIDRFLSQVSTGELAEEARVLLGASSKAERPSSNSENPVSRPATDSQEAPENMALVPAGFFIMGSAVHGDDESPEHRVYLDAFYIDRHEVSASDFAEFLNEFGNVKKHYMDNKFGTLFYDGRFHPRPGLEAHPVNNVKWSGAAAFCRWRGKRLPTEAEWEKGARGTEAPTYPWGQENPNPKLARYFQTWTEELRHHVMVPVHSMPEGKSPYGLFHMAGNVKEWVDDWYDREYYKDPSNHVNPKGPIGGEFKILKGGSWRDLPGFIYSSFRNNSYRDTRLDDYGFRCVKSIKEGSEPKTLTRADDLLIIDRNAS